MVHRRVEAELGDEQLLLALGITDTDHATAEQFGNLSTMLPVAPRSSGHHKGVASSAEISVGRTTWWSIPASWTGWQGTTHVRQHQWISTGLGPNLGRLVQVPGLRQFQMVLGQRSFGNAGHPH